MCQDRALKSPAAAGLVAPGDRFPQKPLSVDPKTATKRPLGLAWTESLIPQVAKCQSLHEKNQHTENTCQQHKEARRAIPIRREDSDS